MSYLSSPLARRACVCIHACAQACGGAINALSCSRESVSDVARRVLSGPLVDAMRASRVAKITVRSRWGVGWGSPRARRAAFGGRDPRGSRSAIRGSLLELVPGRVPLEYDDHGGAAAVCLSLVSFVGSARGVASLCVCAMCDLPCFLLRCRARSAAASPRRARSSDSTRPPSRRPASDPPTRRRGITLLSTAGLDSKSCVAAVPSSAPPRTSDLRTPSSAPSRLRTA